MAKSPTISAMDVEDAATELRFQGKPVNPYQVRKMLGSGSYKLIEEYLRALHLETEYDDEDPLTKQLVGLVRPLAQSLRQEQQTAIEDAQARFQSKAQEWEAKHSNKQKELKIALQTIDELREKSEELAKQNDKLSLSLSETTNESLGQKQQIKSLLDRIEEYKTQIQSLEEKHQHAREALEHFRSSAKDQRERERRQYENQLQQLQMELKQSNQTLSIKQSDITSLNKDNARLVAEVSESKKQVIVLESKVSSLESDLNATSSDLRIKIRELEISESNAEEKADKLAQTTKELQASEQSNINLALEIKGLKTELSVKSDLLDNLTKKK